MFYMYPMKHLLLQTVIKCNKIYHKTQLQYKSLYGSNTDEILNIAKYILNNNLRRLT